MAEIRVRLTAAADIPTIASLRAQRTGARSDPAFEARVREWLIAEGDRRLIWLASLGDEPAGPESQARGYARLVLSPTERAVPFYERAGFVAADASAGGDRMMVRLHQSRT